MYATFGIEAISESDYHPVCEKGATVVMEQPQSELLRLQRDQRKARQDEVFGGLSPAERAGYNARAERIHVLESEIQASSLAEASLKSAQTEQRRQWNKAAETDIPQTHPEQPYRGREKDSTDAFVNSLRTPRAKKSDPEQDRE